MSSRKIKVALIGTEDFGHHISFLGLHLRALLELDAEVTVFSSVSRDTIQKALGTQLDGWDHQQLRCASKLPRITGPFKYTVEGLRFYSELENKIRDKYDLVFFSCIKASLFFWQLRHPFFKKNNWAGLLLQTSKIRETQNDSERLFKNIARNKPQAICSLDETVIEELSHLMDTELLFHPEIVSLSLGNEESKIVDQIQNQKNGRVVIGLIGAVQERKGLADLLQIIEADKDGRYFFIIAGLQGPLKETLKAKLDDLARNASNLLVINQRIETEEEFNQICAAVDIHFACYRQFPQSSNIQAKAAAFNKPIIVSEGHLMARRNIQYNLGPVIEEGNVAAIQEAIEKLSSSSLLTSWREQTKGADFISNHGFNVLKEMFQKLISEVKTS